MRGEGRNVSRPVEFSAARPLLADKAGREKSGLQAASPASTPPARSPQPSALSPRLADAALPSPGKSGCPVGPRGQTKTRGLEAKSKTKTHARFPPGRAKLHRGAARRARDGGAGRGSPGAVTAEALSSPSPCPRQPPPPTPGLTKVCQVPPPRLPSPSGSAASPAHLGAGARCPAPAHLGTRALARPPVAPTAAR